MWAQSDDYLDVFATMYNVSTPWNVSSVTHHSKQPIGWSGFERQRRQGFTRGVRPLLLLLLLNANSSLPPLQNKRHDSSRRQHEASCRANPRHQVLIGLHTWEECVETCEIHHAKVHLHEPWATRRGCIQIRSAHSTPLSAATGNDCS